MNILVRTGVPFHPEDQRPSAVCPLYADSQRDNSVKAVFGVRGFDKKSHDPAIPESFFIVPPKSLDKDGPDMDALKVCATWEKGCQLSIQTSPNLHHLSESVSQILSNCTSNDLGEQKQSCNWSM